MAYDCNGSYAIVIRCRNMLKELHMKRDVPIDLGTVA